MGPIMMMLMTMTMMTTTMISMLKVLAGHTAGGLITSTTYAGGLKVNTLSHHTAMDSYTFTFQFE